MSSWDAYGPCLASTTCFNCGLLLVFDVLAGVVAPFAFGRPDIYGELALGEQFLLVDGAASLKPVREELALVCWWWLSILLASGAERSLPVARFPSRT